MTQDRRQALSEEIERVHRAAMRAIADGRPAVYGEVAQSYIEALTSFPRAAAKYGVPYDELPAGTSPFDLGPVREIARHLAAEMREAIAIGSTELVPEVLGLPSRVAREAFNLNALRLLQEMLNLYAAVYAQVPASESHAPAMSKVTRSPLDFGRYVVAPRLDAEDTKARAQAAMGSVYGATLTILKVAIDRGDIATLEALDRQWEDTPSRWQSTAADDRPWDKRRSAQRFGLCWWALRRIRRGSSASPRTVDAYRILESRFGSLRALAEAAGEAITIAGEGFDWPWLGWVFEEHEGTHAGFAPAPDLELAAAFSVMAIRRLESTTAANELDDYGWVAQYADQLTGQIEQAANESELWSSLERPSDLETRAARLVGIVRHAAATQRSGSAERIRAASLSEDKVDEFRAAVVAGWRANRSAVAMLESVGAYEVTEPPSEPAAQYFGRQEWLPKEWFLPDSNIGLESFAREFGNAVATGETELVAASLGHTEAQVAVTEAEGWVRRAKQELEANGYSPSAIVIPPSWRLRQKLGLTEPAPPQGAAPLGEHDGLPAFQMSLYGQSLLAVVDWARLAHMRQWAVGEGPLLTVEIQAFTEDEALEVVRAQPNLFSDAGESEELRAAALRERILLTIREYFDFEVLNAAAKRVVLVAGN